MSVAGVLCNSAHSWASFTSEITFIDYGKYAQGGGGMMGEYSDAIFQNV